MDYNCISTTVYTPLEYGCCGYTSAEAVEKFGRANIDIYHNRFRPIEMIFNLKKDYNEESYVRVIVNKRENNRVIGFHLLSPNAGEVTQGFAILIKMGVTYEKFANSVFLFPTIAGEILRLESTVDSNPAAERKASFML